MHSLMRTSRYSSDEKLWIMISHLSLLVGLGGFGGPPLGGLFSSIGMSKYWGQLIAYLFLAFLVFLFFKFLESRGKSSLRDSDWFGRGDYSLGVILCMMKHFCVLLFFLALLNAKPVTAAMVTASREKQIKELGSALFPTFPVVNHNVFVYSFVGPYLKKGWKWVLLEPISAAPAPRTTF
ncbi:MAG: hypothetical protein CMO80_15760 [Verrucomicrobiales bacterium]|nr:hypothetical protein [Verrucomicrobiales bacterium]|tara:strand:- start:2412 stop:2951 length:540 start_codon:yes stop_codon:yes gene_type:complete